MYVPRLEPLFPIAYYMVMFLKTKLAQVWVIQKKDNIRWRGTKMFINKIFPPKTAILIFFFILIHWPIP